MSNEEEIVGAGNGVEYAQVGGKKKSKTSKRKTGRKMNKGKKAKKVKRKTAKKLQKRRR